MAETCDAVELQKMINAKVVNYYNATQEGYNKYYITKHRGIHYGYWDDTVRSHEEALAKMDEVCANMAEIKKDDLVLDAGCGVGGSSIWIAKNIGARVIGITLVPMQVELAKTFAIEKGVEHIVSFKVMDFMNTEFDDETFDVVWAIESACYAVDKRLFLAESHRILKKGGRLMVSDAFLYKDEKKLTELEIRAYKESISGFAVPNLATIEQFRKYLIDLGFDNITFRDITENILPTAKFVHSLGRKGLWLWCGLWGWWWLPVKKLINSLGSKTSKVNQPNLLSEFEIQLADIRAAVAQLKLIEDGIGGRAIFCAKKR